MQEGQHRQPSRRAAWEITNCSVKDEDLFCSILLTKIINRFWMVPLLDGAEVLQLRGRDRGREMIELEALGVSTEQHTLSTEVSKFDRP